MLLALIIMETDKYHATAFYPGFFANFVTQYLHDSLPLVDICVCLLVIIVAILGILRNIPHFQQEPDLNELRLSFFMLSIGLMVGGILIAIGVAVARGSTSG